VEHEGHGCPQGRIGKAKGKREVVEIENCKEQVEDAGEEMNALFGSEAIQKE